MSKSFDEHLRGNPTLESIYVGHAFAYLEDILKREMRIDENAHEHNRLKNTPHAQRWVYYEAAQWWSVTRESLAAFGKTLDNLDDKEACSRAYDRWCLTDTTYLEVETAAHRYGGFS